MKHKIAVVEDDPKILEAVVQALAHEGYIVRSAPDGRAALRLFDQEPFDLAVLDWNLPELTGIQICRHLREKKKTAKISILMLSVLGETRQKVSAFDTGADDYLTKPFDMPELLARVSSLLRRKGDGAASMDQLHLGPLKVNAASHNVTVNGKKVKLRPKEFELLHLLMKTPGRVLSRSHLLERIWGFDSGELKSRTVDSHVARLREKLGRQAGYMIQTISRFGYKIEEGR